MVQVDLPGLKDDDVEVHVEGDRLVLRGQRRPSETTRPDNYYRMERSYGPFSRTFILTPDVDPDRVTADLQGRPAPARPAEDAAAAAVAGPRGKRRGVSRGWLGRGSARSSARRISSARRSSPRRSRCRRPTASGWPASSSASTSSPRSSRSPTSGRQLGDPRRGPLAAGDRPRPAVQGDPRAVREEPRLPGQGAGHAPPDRDVGPAGPRRGRGDRVQDRRAPGAADRPRRQHQERDRGGAAGPEGRAEEAHPQRAAGGRRAAPPAGAPPRRPRRRSRP